MDFNLKALQTNIIAQLIILLWLLFSSGIYAKTLHNLTPTDSHKQSDESTMTSVLTENDSLSYALGYDQKESVFEYLKELQKLEISLNLNQVEQGVADANLPYIGDRFNNSKVPFRQLRRLIYAFEAELKQKQQIIAQQNSHHNLISGLEYLEKNKHQTNVISLPSGLQYKILKRSTGIQPEYFDKVRLNVICQLIDGTEVLNTYQQETIPPWQELGQMIAGWAEAILKMHVGEIWEITIPPELAFGASQHHQIPANSVLIYQLELLEIQNK